jgi:hypothetical protein
MDCTPDSANPEKDLPGNALLFEDDAGSDSCITSDMSDTDNEASKEYFN